jgi:hypothetical protein
MANSSAATRWTLKQPSATERGRLLMQLSLKMIEHVEESWQQSNTANAAPRSRQ